MKVLLVYDKLSATTCPDDLPEDFGAEYESTQTVDALLAAIRACGHDAEGLVFDEDFVQQIQAARPDMVFNIAEGVRGRGRESIVPSWLDHLGVPYTGSDGLTLAISLDKGLTKSLAAAHGVYTPPFAVVVSSEADVYEVDVPLPAFVKPNGEGSSMGIRDSSLVESPDQLQRQVNWVLQTYQQPCLIEAFAPGRELSVGMLGNNPPQLFPIAELVTEGPFNSYESKHQHRNRYICPADVSPELAEELQDMAMAVFDVLGCRDLGRVDFRLDDEDEPTFLEINPLPGLAPGNSLFPCMAEAAGLSFDEMVGRIIEHAHERARQTTFV